MFITYSFLYQAYFESDEVHACIVTCGGLCPGLNTVIREIVCGLYHMYGVTRVLGIDVSCYDFHLDIFMHHFHISIAVCSILHSRKAICSEIHMSMLY